MLEKLTLNRIGQLLLSMALSSVVLFATAMYFIFCDDKMLNINDIIIKYMYFINTIVIFISLIKLDITFGD